MSYEITFKGLLSPSIIVNNDRGEKVKELWFMGKKDTPIDIDGNGYLIGDIKRITQVADPEIKDPWANSNQQLEAGDVCRGQYSIAKEIMGIASRQKNWKLLQDKQWRKDQEARLRATGRKFCDARTGECACDKQLVNR